MKGLKFIPKRGGSTSPEWWVNINRNGGSTWFGIYTCMSLFRCGIIENKRLRLIKLIGQVETRVEEYLVTPQ